MWGLAWLAGPHAHECGEVLAMGLPGAGRNEPRYFGAPSLTNVLGTDPAAAHIVVSYYS